MMHKKRFSVCLCALVILFNLSLIMLPASAESDLPIQAGDILCFGTPDAKSGFDGQWLVLDPAHTNTGEDGILVVSLHLVGDNEGEPLLFRDIGDVTVSFIDTGTAYAEAHPGSNAYQGSDIQQWCAAFPGRYLSYDEQEALLATYTSDEAFSTPAAMPGANTLSATVDFSAAENILDGDTIFLLSAEEITNTAYGFTDPASRVALFKGEAQGYWLRSPHTPSFPLDVGFVFSFGSVMDYPVNAKSGFAMPSYARPACNLDRAKITGLEALSSEEDRTVWRVSFQDNE